MTRVRNLVVIIILCIIGAYTFNKRTGTDLTMPKAVEELKDAVAAKPAVKAARKAKKQALKLAPIVEDALKDALAQNPAVIPSEPSQDGTTEDKTPPPPRGSGSGGIGALSSNNPGSELPPNPPPQEISPSEPENNQFTESPQ